MREKKGPCQERSQACLSLPPLPCIHSSCPQGYGCGHLWGNNPVRGFISSWKFSANFNFGHFLSSGVVCSLLEKSEGKCNANNIASSPARFPF